MWTSTLPVRSATQRHDPVRCSDLYSRTVTPHIFESLYTYGHVARPAKLRPSTAMAMPEVSKDFCVWTMRVKPGIHFADDPAFKGAAVNSWRRTMSMPSSALPDHRSIDAG
jgi:ABC-type oligopeptide transport system substrate-binding subunit